MSEERTFVVPYDFSDHADAALYAAVDLARRLDANLHLVHVIQLPAYAYGYGGVGGAFVATPRVDAGIREDAAQSLRRVVDRIRDFPGRLSAEVIEGTNVAEAISETAKKLGAELIVMGTHGRTGLAHVFLGSVAERTLRRAPCPVLTIRSDDEREAA